MYYVASCALFVIEIGTTCMERNKMMVMKSKWQRRRRVQAAWVSRRDVFSCTCFLVLVPSCQESVTAPPKKHRRGPKHGCELAERCNLTSLCSFLLRDSHFELVPEILSGVTCNGSMCGCLADGVVMLLTLWSPFNAPNVITGLIFDLVSLLPGYKLAVSLA